MVGDARVIDALILRDGVVTAIAADDIDDALRDRRHDAFLWVHIQAAVKSPEALGHLAVDVPPAVLRALTAMETRPRCDLFAAGVLINLRVPHEPDADDIRLRGADILASMRLWAEHGLILSVSYRSTTVIEPLRQLFLDGALHDPGDLIIALAMMSAEAIDHTVAAIGDAVDNLECTVDQAMKPSEAHASRRAVTQFRSQAIGYRRFVVPQRRALEVMATLPLDWVDENERAALREAADRFARMGEELESVRERSAVIHDELTDLRSERIDTRSLRISVIATIFLPLTFITGLLGMNVAGIPFAQEPWAFAGVSLGCIIFSTALFWYLSRKNEV